MQFSPIKSLSQQLFKGAVAPGDHRLNIVRTRGLIWPLLAGCLFCSFIRIQAQTLSLDASAPSMTGVTDVTGGTRFLLQDQDIVSLQIKQHGDTVTTSLVTSDTSNSTLSKTAQTTTINQFDAAGAFSTSGGNLASEAAGRMYNTTSDVAAVLNAVNDGGTPAWAFTIIDPLTKFTQTANLSARFAPSGTVSTRVIMGDFNGDGLLDVLAVYTSQNGGNLQWGMTALTAASTDNPDRKESGFPFEGPAFFGAALDVPFLPSSFVVGDFNNDGRDEIAALGTDNQTVEFYAVDPVTFTINPTSTIKLPNAMVSGQVALAAGRFRNQSPSLTNADLVVFGQIAKSTNGYSVIPIRITPNSDGTFSPKLVTPFLSFS